MRWWLYRSFLAAGLTTGQGPVVPRPSRPIGRGTLPPARLHRHSVPPRPDPVESPGAHAPERNGRFFAIQHGRLVVEDYNQDAARCLLVNVARHDWHRAVDICEKWPERTQLVA
jgi:hypothetical protein